MKPPVIIPKPEQPNPAAESTAETPACGTGTFIDDDTRIAFLEKNKMVIIEAEKKLVKRIYDYDRTQFEYWMAQLTGIKEVIKNIERLKERIAAQGGAKNG